MIPKTVPAKRFEQIPDRQLQKVQNNANETAALLRNIPTNVTTVGPFTFTAGQSVVITHKLGVTPTEWAAVDVTGGYGSFRREAWDSMSLTIKSENACTAKFRLGVL